MSCDVLLAFGSNQQIGGKKPETVLNDAVRDLIKKGFHPEAVSQCYTSPAFPAGSGPDFSNAVGRFRFLGTPVDVMEIVHDVETTYHRERVVRWSARSLDIDLLAFNDVVLPDLEGYSAWRSLDLEEQKRQVPDQLVVPHPRIQDRAFVLVPLAEIAPDWCHPVLKKTAVEMLEDLALEDVEAVVPTGRFSL